jgi:hypothetical protein
MRSCDSSPEPKMLRGTEGSNPAPSSGESVANRTSSVTAQVRGGRARRWPRLLARITACADRGPPACDVIFTANSGHERGHLGLDDFMAHRPGSERPISEGGATRIHFGANIGAADGKLSLQSASDDLRQLTEAELARAGQEPGVVAPKTFVPGGETRDIHRAGGCYVTLVGSNPLFICRKTGGLTRSLPMS